VNQEQLERKEVMKTMSTRELTIVGIASFGLAFQAVADVTMRFDNNLDTIAAGVGAGVDTGTEQYSTDTPFPATSTHSLDLDGSTRILLGGNSGPVPVGGNAPNGSSVGDVATGGAFTFAAYINPDGTGTGTILAKRNRQISSFNAPRFTFTQAGSQLWFDASEGTLDYANAAGVPNPGDYSDENNFIITPGGTLSVGTWTHVALVYGGAGGTQTIYVNGVDILNQAIPAGFAPDGLDSFELLPNNGNNMYLGSWPTGSGTAGVEYFDGQMDNVFFAQSALSQTQIQALADGSLIPEPASVLLLLLGGLLVGWGRRIRG
jgi:hypothetical protein